MTEIMPVPRNLSFTVLPAERLRAALLLFRAESQEEGRAVSGSAPFGVMHMYK